MVAKGKKKTPRKEMARKEIAPKEITPKETAQKEIPPAEIPQRETPEKVVEKPPTPTFLAHPAAQLIFLALALTAALRAIFFHYAERIWAMAENVPMADITVWARWAMSDRDGTEGQYLLALVVVLCVLTTLGMQLLSRAPVRLRETLTALCLIVAVFFAVGVPPRAPMPDIDASGLHVFLVELGILLAALAAWWAAQKRWFPAALAVFLMPVCFLVVSRPSMSDLSCILAPALRLRSGFGPTQVYMQYDFLMTLLAVGWHKVGGDPAAFPRITEVSFYLMLMGSFLVAKRLFRNVRLAGLLMVALCAVRIYGIMHDANAVPQVTALRIDLWILLLAPALFLGLRHWSVGLAAGAVYFFTRSFGMLYLGSYALALVADFVTLRLDRKEPFSLPRDIVAYVRSLLPALALVAVGLLAAQLVFGAVVSEAMVTYRRLGLGMMRISPASFYWWIAPLLAGMGWLAFSGRESLGPRRTSACFLLLALAIGNSIYFFGRSHEHNLLNISAVLLFCFFLAIDLAAAAWRTGPAWVRWMVAAVPWVGLALVGFNYSGRLVSKIATQYASVVRHQPVPVQDSPGVIDCEEVRAATKDSRVFFFSVGDYWFCEKCGYVPQGYVQPLLLQPLRRPLIRQLNQLLDSGFKIVVPKEVSYSVEFPDVKDDLHELVRLETTHYEVYSRKR